MRLAMSSAPRTQLAAALSMGYSRMMAASQMDCTSLAKLLTL